MIVDLADLAIQQRELVNYIQQTQNYNPLGSVKAENQTLPMFSAEQLTRIKQSLRIFNRCFTVQFWKQSVFKLCMNSKINQTN